MAQRYELYVMNAMNVVLIEDEDIAMRKLRNMVLAVDATVSIVAELSSVEEAKAWFQKEGNGRIDVIFSDIQLSDGLSFEVFEAAHVSLPIVFTTAYNEYAVQAFTVNGIDYLLKPLREEDIRRALKKFHQTRTLYTQTQLLELQDALRTLQHNATQAVMNPTLTAQMPSFVAISGDRMIPIAGEDVAFFVVQHQSVRAVLYDQHHYKLEGTLEDIEQRLPKREFFRANRQYIIARRAVKEAEFYFHNRLLVHLHPNAPEPVVISREKATLFRSWLQGR
jgi:two-component system LytT family response regulator